MHVRTLIDRVRGEFNEMPGLQLTVPQAARLLGIPPEACRKVIDQLVAAEFLRRTPTGTIVRAER
jgi:predicted ArsR family transcriptional regulator